MGVKGSKPNSLQYEEALNRVTDSELKRLKEAFKRLSANQGVLTKQAFVKEVLGDGVPVPMAHFIYTACGGTSRGIALKELLCGLVLLTRGTEEEKLKFLFGLYSPDGIRLNRNEFIQRLESAGESPPKAIVLNQLFTSDTESRGGPGIDEFSEWLSNHPTECGSLARWLFRASESSSYSSYDGCLTTGGASLANELDGQPRSFYQTIAGVTHLEERDATELEKRYSSLHQTPTSSSTSSVLDLTALIPLVSPPLPLALCPGLLNALDENRDGQVDFKELACGVSAACRGPVAERHKFCFKIFDTDCDGVLSPIEMEAAAELLVLLANEEQPESTGINEFNLNQSRHIEMDMNSVLADMHIYTSNISRGLTIQEYLMWAVNHPLGNLILDLVFQVCHVVLGLGPQTIQDEGRLVRQWLAREKRRGLRDAQFWYLVSRSWWDKWSAYTSPNKSKTMNGDIITSQTTTSSIKPGPIDNSSLIIPNNSKTNSLTGEGGRLHKSPPLIEGRDYELLPDALWKALHHWYSGGPALPRQVIAPDGGDPEIELFPIILHILRHQAPHTAAVTVALGATGPPKRYLAHSAAFSRLARVGHVYDFLSIRLGILKEDIRIWQCHSDNIGMVLWEDEHSTLESLGVEDSDRILLEVRNADLTWPEELGSLMVAVAASVSTLCITPGATGLNNLGNTCFMNAALQCVSNTQPLTKYFLANWHLQELNRVNPLGMRGHMAKRYGELVHQLWQGSSKAIAPLKLRLTIGKYAPRFSDCQQHDAQELLAFLLDGLHEDLNRVQERGTYDELCDSDGRDDSIVAQEAWNHHLKRNRSIIVELFHGQLKSTIRCLSCEHASTRFDPLSYLSLPLPAQNLALYIQVIVVRLDGSIPVRYGLRLPVIASCGDIKKAVCRLTGIPANQIVLALIANAKIKITPSDELSAANAPLPFGLQSPVTWHAYQVLSTPLPLPLALNGDEREADLFAEIQRSTELLLLQRQKSNSNSTTNLSKTSLITNKTTILKNEVRTNGNSLSLLGGRPEAISNGLPSTLSTNSSLGMNENNNNSSIESIPDLSSTKNSNESVLQQGYLIAVHRKMVRQDAYFLAAHKSRPELFGSPILVPFISGKTNKQQLYATIWLQVSRLVTPLPARDKSSRQTANHAQDCDDSLGYEFPFLLRAVRPRSAMWCAWCPWFRFCRGCRIQCRANEFLYSNDDHANVEFDAEGRHPPFWVAIDWDLSALHLRYRSAMEHVVYDDTSVAEAKEAHMKPVSLRDCLQAFFKPEKLSAEDGGYHCPRCKSPQAATKTLSLWRLPPILIIHLKRFQAAQDAKWIKCTRPVHGCLDLDLTDLQMQETFTDLHEHKLLPGFDSNKVEYRLYAAVSHSGLLSGGHYIAHAQHPNGSWLCFNDSSCKEGTNNLDPSALYILFYERLGLDQEAYLPKGPAPNGSLLLANADDDQDNLDGELSRACRIM